ncbi:MAG: 3-oxoacyl-ACP synthase [Gemmatimonadetes bacterium GWC2_71_10]|nr:MAG: 3-oxoacyl-ACP synthase [Gemmatimonadetes bacterium GWC2_71_10]
MKTPFAQLAGLGSWVPDKILTNADFEHMLETSDTWIRERTGIRERHIAERTTRTVEMAQAAAERALTEAGLTGADVDTIIFATATPDRLLPSTACDLQALLGAKQATAFDIQAACSGWVYGLVLGESMLRSGTGERILVVGAEKLSAITDYTDRSTAVLFGDGAGVAVLTKGDGSRGIVSSYLRSDGTLAELLWRPGGGTVSPPSPEMIAERSYYIKMAGREVFKNAVRNMADAASKALERAGITSDQVDLLVPHQANIRIIEATAEHAHIPLDRVYVNVDRYGNTSSASIPIALDEARRCGRLTPGMTVMLVTFGAGFTWGSMVLKW